MLFNALVHLLAGKYVRECRLTVSQKNLPAIRLNGKGGFLPEYYCMDYFGVGEDRIVTKNMFQRAKC